MIGAGFTGLWTAICIQEQYPEKSAFSIGTECRPIRSFNEKCRFCLFQKPYRSNCRFTENGVGEKHRNLLK